MTDPTERTRLVPENEDQPQYVFSSSVNRERKRRVRQFQCCLCFIFLSLFLITLIITVVYSINEEESAGNSALPNDNPLNETEFVSPIFILLSNNLPIEDVRNTIRSTNDTQLWEEAIEFGKKGLKEKDEIEKHVPSLQLRSPSYRHQRVVATSERGRNLSRIGFIEEYATKHIHRNKTDNNIVEKICHAENMTSADYCRRNITLCNRLSKYRTYNGTCNNLKYPEEYGVAYRPFRRTLPPDYADGISKPRVSKNGSALPSARTVSLFCHRPYYKSDPKFTVMLAVWGQFLDHDITATALSQKSNGSTISCCDPPAESSPECFPVYLDQEDPFREYNVSCIEFVRSAPSPTCCFGPREQLNQATPVIDGSVIYSVDEEFVKVLRDMKNGTMKVFVTSDGRTLLPLSEDLEDGCNREEEERNGKYCFMSGDPRANENLHLTAMHLLWVRQHNLLAKNVSDMNPHWDDERIFQETRRIVAAQMQHITYNEFLPILLGDNLMKKFDLYPMKKGYFKNYSEEIDPSIANNFAAANFRFAHSIIPGLMKLLSNESSVEYIQMHKMLFNPFELYKVGELDRTLRGAMNTTIQASDPYFTDQLKSHMFEKTSEQVKQPKLCGLDLVSLNIQRGRDHGLPGYSSWREHCGLKRPRNFDDLKDDFHPDALHNIKTIYRYYFFN
nr:chorion peroxidase [Leptinotarsa decemlineata]